MADRILRDTDGRVRYHYVLLDYLATPQAGCPEAGSDALAVQWRDVGELGGADVTEGLEAMVRRALAMDGERRQGEETR